MEADIYCLVDADGVVHVKDGATCYADVAAACGLDEEACQKYRFDLSHRRLVADRGGPSGEPVARAYLDRCVGTADRLIAFAAEGRLPNEVLVALLDAKGRRDYLRACAAIQEHYTAACAAAGDPCLEPGCAVAGNGEVCLQPLLRSQAEYHKACAAEWARSFASPANRVDAWRA